MILKTDFLRCFLPWLPMYEETLYEYVAAHNFLALTIETKFRNGLYPRETLHFHNSLINKHFSKTIRVFITGTFLPRNRNDIQMGCQHTWRLARITAKLWCIWTPHRNTLMPAHWRVYVNIFSAVGKHSRAYASQYHRLRATKEFGSTVAALHTQN